MNKLEVGMYVRFNYHRVTVPIQISKIKEKHYEDIERYYYYLTDNELVISEAQILKASFDIIDLIEVGDVITTINLCGEVTKIDKENNKIYTTCYDGEYCHKEDIKTVVTKEQFESMSYRIGGK